VFEVEQFERRQHSGFADGKPRKRRDSLPSGLLQQPVTGRIRILPYRDNQRRVRVEQSSLRRKHKKLQRKNQTQKKVTPQPQEVEVLSNPTQLQLNKKTTPKTTPHTHRNKEATHTSKARRNLEKEA
jgi:hypothetical protein